MIHVKLAVSDSTWNDITFFTLQYGCDASNFVIHEVTTHNIFTKQDVID